MRSTKNSNRPLAQRIADRLDMRLGPLAPAVAPLMEVQLRPRLGVDAGRLRPINGIARVGAPALLAEAAGAGGVLAGAQMCARRRTSPP